MSGAEVRNPTAAAEIADAAAEVGRSAELQSDSSEAVVALEAALGEETVRLLQASFVIREGDGVPNSAIDSSAESSLSTIARRTFARLSEAPANYHQATIYFLQSPGVNTGAAMFFVSCCITLFQALAATAIFVGADVKACSGQDQCRSGTFCGQQARGLGVIRCYYCGEDGPLDKETNAAGIVLNIPQTAWDGDPNGENYAGFNLTKVIGLCSDPRMEHPYMGTERNSNAAKTVQALQNWCHGCRYSDGTVDPSSWFGQAQANEQAMSLFDWLSLLFCAAIVGLALAGTSHARRHKAPSAPTGLRVDSDAQCKNSRMHR